MIEAVVKDNGIVQLPEEIKKDMGLKKGAKLFFFKASDFVKKADPQVFNVLKKIKSSKAKPSMAQISRAVEEYRSRKASG